MIDGLFAEHNVASLSNFGMRLLQLMIWTYLSLFKRLVQLTTQCIFGFFDRPCPAGQVHGK